MPQKHVGMVTTSYNFNVFYDQNGISKRVPPGLGGSHVRFPKVGKVRTRAPCAVAAHMRLCDREI